MRQTRRQYFAVVRWQPEDLEDARPDWTRKECVEFLQSCEDKIQDYMVEKGWDMIDHCLDSEEYGEGSEAGRVTKGIIKEIIGDE